MYDLGKKQNLYKLSEKEKENDLLLRIKKLRLEDQRILEKNEFLKVWDEKEKAPLVQELCAKQPKIDELGREIRKKNEELDVGMKLQKKLVELVQSKTSLILDKESQMKDNEENTEIVRLEKKIPDTSVAAGDTNKVKEKKLEEDKRGAKSSPPSRTSCCVPKCPISTKSVSISGTKRQASSRRQTRSHQGRGPDHSSREYQSRFR
ncbi:hypothetical protein L6164_017997 [Bauhinia variegata]|uniref:Uncharacterized protein n=1 Tax=Bauhinia variegata TaxID=167791 RepID=A0ACB9NAC1_BAUVA|nr:hypothetical protein L6164_017997 [Bauhinia variegata]